MTDPITDFSLRAPLQAPPLGRKPAFTAPTELLALERQQARQS